MEAKPHLWAGPLDYVTNVSFSFQGQKGDPGLSPGKARNGQKVRCPRGHGGLLELRAHTGALYCSHKHASCSARLRLGNKA